MDCIEVRQSTMYAVMSIAFHPTQPYALLVSRTWNRGLWIIPPVHVLLRVLPQVEDVQFAPQYSSYARLGSIDAPLGSAPASSPITTQKTLSTIGRSHMAISPDGTYALLVRTRALTALVTSGAALAFLHTSFRLDGISLDTHKLLLLISKRWWLLCRLRRHPLRSPNL